MIKYVIYILYSLQGLINILHPPRFFYKHLACNNMASYAPV